MKTLKFVCVVCLVYTASFAHGQLSVRENIDSTVLRMGTRPQMGNYGLFIGPSLSTIVDLAGFSEDYDEVVLVALPLMNLKYYKTNRMEWRFGLQLANMKDALKGEENNTSTKAKEKYSETVFRLTPGMAYHFSPRNMLDVYMGGGLVVGCNAYTKKSEYGDSYTNVSQMSIVGGFNGYVGLQAFIADLPLSVGIEYGISALADYGMKYKHKVSSGGDEQVYYTTDRDGRETPYKTLNNKASIIGTDVKITFSYYFNK